MRRSLVSLIILIRFAIATGSIRCAETAATKEDKNARIEEILSLFRQPGWRLERSRVLTSDQTLELLRELERLCTDNADYVITLESAKILLAASDISEANCNTGHISYCLEAIKRFSEESDSMRLFLFEQMTRQLELCALPVKRAHDRIDADTRKDLAALRWAIWKADLEKHLFFLHEPEQVNHKSVAKGILDYMMNHCGALKEANPHEAYFRAEFDSTVRKLCRGFIEKFTPELKRIEMFHVALGTELEKLMDWKARDMARNYRVCSVALEAFWETYSVRLCLLNMKSPLDEDYCYE